MIRTIWFAVPMMALLFAAGANAQNIVFNGDFETADYIHGWTLTGGSGNAVVEVFETVMGEHSLCLKRCPGTPFNNGGFEQLVHLEEGVTYEFNANIAAFENG